MEKDKLIQKEVFHSKYGKGRIIECPSEYIIVQFHSLMMKKFKYPDAFENFLQITDESLKEDIQKDLCERAKDESYIEEQKSLNQLKNIDLFIQKRRDEQELKIQLQRERQRMIQMARDKKYGKSKTES